MKYNEAALRTLAEQFAVLDQLWTTEDDPRWWRALRTLDPRLARALIATWQTHVPDHHEWLVERSRDLRRESRT